MHYEAIRELLERLHDKYNDTDFIADDPISVPHRFSAREDIEISGFLAATIAWGNRKAIVKSANRMIECMDGTPYDFTMNASERELDSVLGYVHRTFNGGDFRSFILSLRHVFETYGSIGGFFEGEFSHSGDIRTAISKFRSEFFTPCHEPRCEKHLSSIDRGAACKRTNMYLRWMVRRDVRGVDFGLWEGIPMSALYLPLDVHSGNTARALGLLTRRQSDWKSVEEVTANLRLIDKTDPVRFDYALFGAGIAGEFK